MASTQTWAVWSYAQVKPPAPQEPRLDEPPPREPVSTVMAPKLRWAWLDWHAGQRGLRPSEYSDIEALIVNVSPQSLQV